MKQPIQKTSYFIIFFVITFYNVVIANSTLTSNIIIDFSKQKFITPFLGNNLQAHDWTLNYPNKKYPPNMSNTKYGAGLWNPVTHRPVAALIKLAKQLKTATLRFPGGMGANYYDWKGAIGPINLRKKGYIFGPDEFMQVVTEVAAAPIITLSYFDWDNNYQADFIEYLAAKAGTNPNAGTAWADIRASNGHFEPYPIKYIEFGNEVYLGDKQDEAIVDPKVYAQRYLETQALIKNINPTLQLGAVFKNSLEYDLSPWDLAIAGKIKEKLDFAIIHFYPMKYTSNNNKLKADKIFSIALSSAQQIKLNLESYSRTLKSLTGKNIPFAITEFNGGFIQNKPIPYRHTLGNALLNMDLIQVLTQINIPIISANYWQFIDSYWGALYNKNYIKELDKGIEGKYLKRPNFYVLEMYAKYLSEYLLESTVVTQSYVSEGYSNVHGTYNLKPAVIKTSAAKTKKKVVFVAKKQSFKAKDWSNIYDPFGVSTEIKSNEVVVTFKGSKDPNYYHTKLNHIAIEATHRYKLSGKISLEKLSSTEGLYLEIQDQRGWKNTHWAKGTKEYFNTDGWIEVNIEFVPLSDSKEIKIFIRRKSGGGTILGVARIKDLVLEDLGHAIKYPATDYLSVMASTDKNSNKLYLIVINKHLSKAMESNISLKNFQPAKIAQSHILNAPAIDSTNEVNAETVKIKHKPFKLNYSNGFFNYKFEPHSVTAIELFNLEKP
ncbi:MAG: alpha-L-arabinofuranosidase C-terminal domain-containing protein [Pseudomonadota bacterium]